MPTFSLGGIDATFNGMIERTADRAWLIEELTLGFVIGDPATWGALFGMVTPKEMVSVRVAKAQDGTSTVVIDIGGGAGVGHLDMSDVGFDSHDAILIDLMSDGPVGQGDVAIRVGKAVFWLIPGT